MESLGKPGLFCVIYCLWTKLGCEDHWGQFALTAEDRDALGCLLPGRPMPRMRRAAPPWRLGDWKGCSPIRLFETGVRCVDPLVLCRPPSAQRTRSRIYQFPQEARGSV